MSKSIFFPAAPIKGIEIEINYNHMVPERLGAIREEVVVANHVNLCETCITKAADGTITSQCAKAHMDDNARTNEASRDLTLTVPNCKYVEDVQKCVADHARSNPCIDFYYDVPKPTDKGLIGITFSATGKESTNTLAAFLRQNALIK